MDFNVIIIQPVVPSYRVDFFNRLAKRLAIKCPVKIYASNVDHLGVKSVNKSDVFYEELGPIKSILSIFLYQKGVLDIPINRGDIVFINGNPRFISNLLLLVKIKMVGAKIVWWGHGWSSTSVQWRAKIRTKIMAFFDYVLLYTEAEIDSIRILGYNKENVMALNNGLNVKSIQSLVGEIDRQYNSDILFIGRLTDKSKLNQIIYAISLLEFKKDFHLHVIGDGPLKDEYIKMSKIYNVENRIIWHGEILDEYKIANISNLCRGFVYSGSVGLSIIHAFAYGLPAVVHRNRLHHMPEIAAFEEGYNGLGFDENDEKSLADAIDIILSNNDLVSTMSENARATVAKSFNLEDMVERFYKVIEKLI